MEKKRIGELLIEEGYVTDDQLRKALTVQKTKRDRIGSILIDLGYLTEQSFLEFLGNIPGMASIELPRCEIDREILNLVPKKIARRLELVPIGKLKNLLTVAMVCPLDEVGRKELEEVTGMRVKPVLCSRGAVSMALARYYNGTEDGEPRHDPEKNLSELEQSLKLRRVARLVEEIEELPTLPDMLNLLSSVVHDPHSSATDVSRVIASDSALSAKILKLANSAAFGFSRKISNIQHAVALLGLKETYAFALSVLVVDQFAELTQFDFRGYWNHSFSCASLAKLISSGMESRMSESAFVAGLLHDMGKVVLAMSMKGKHDKAASLLQADVKSPVEAEEKVCGVTHAEVGYLLAEHWFLPPELTQAIRYHHAPELQSATKGLAPIVFLANSFCKTASVSEPEPAVEGKVVEALRKLGLSENVFRSRLRSFAEMSDTMTIF
jgi:HD-like signal output (HDOD) protein